MCSAFRGFLKNKLTKLPRLAGLGKPRVFLRQEIFFPKEKKKERKKKNVQKNRKMGVGYVVNYIPQSMPWPKCESPIFIAGGKNLGSYSDMRKHKISNKQDISLQTLGMLSTMTCVIKVCIAFLAQEKLMAKQLLASLNCV